MRIVYSILLFEQQKYLVSIGQWYVKGVILTLLHVLSHLIYIIRLKIYPSHFTDEIILPHIAKQLVEDHKANK